METTKTNEMSNEEINKAIESKASDLAKVIHCNRIVSELCTSLVLGASIRFNLFSEFHPLMMRIEYIYGCPALFSISIDGIDNKFIDLRSYLINRCIEVPDTIIVNRKNIDPNMFINNYFNWLEIVIADEIVPMFINGGWIEIPFDWGDR